MLEIGSSYGHCTAVLAQQAASVLGIDISAHAVAQAQERHPGIQFRQLDALSSPAALEAAAQGCTAVFVDINGDRWGGRLLPSVGRAGASSCRAATQAGVSAAPACFPRRQPRPCIWQTHRHAI